MTPEPDEPEMNIDAFAGAPSPFPKGPKKIRQRIRSYERKLRREKELIGSYDDGYGKRFLLGSLYALMGDLEGALTHYEWYEHEFPDDGAEPYNHLTWALVLRRAGRGEEAFHKLYQTMLGNLYLVPHLLGEKPARLDIRGRSNFEWLEYALAIPQELLDLWDEASLTWARSVYADPQVVERRARYVGIERQLDTEPVGPRRTALVEEASALRRERFRIKM